MALTLADIEAAEVPVGLTLEAATDLESRVYPDAPGGEVWLAVCALAHREVKLCLAMGLPPTPALRLAFLTGFSHGYRAGVAENARLAVGGIFDSGGKAEGDGE